MKIYPVMKKQKDNLHVDLLKLMKDTKITLHIKYLMLARLGFLQENSQYRLHRKSEILADSL